PTRPEKSFERAAYLHPDKFRHSSSIRVPRLRLRGLALFAGLIAKFFLQQLTQTSTRFMQLRLRISDRATHNFGDLVVLVTLDVVEHEHGLIARRQFPDGTFEIDPVYGAAEPQVRRSRILPWATGLLIGLDGFFQ